MSARSQRSAWSPPWRAALAVPWARAAAAYALAVAGVAAATVVVGAAQGALRIGNLALLYLPVVLWLASVFGRGPAVLAALLAVLADDYFFIPPLHRLTVDAPAEWIELFVLLATALVLGQRTAAVEARAREARESQRRTATLYALSQLIASTTEYDALLAALAGRVLAVFAPGGVAACAILTPEGQGEPAVRAAAALTGTGAALVRAVRAEDRDHRAQAAWVLQHGAPAGGAAAPAPSETSPAASEASGVCYFAPLRGRGRVIGALGVAGGAEVRALFAGASHQHGARLPLPGEATNQAARAALFAAFCEQIALALDRASLQEQAIHAEALREGDRLKDALLGSVTHDLRTPLASIKAAADSLLGPGVARGEEDRRDLLESITASADRLNRLVGNLLDLSRLEAGVAPPERGWYLLGDLVATVLDRLELAGLLHGRRVTVALPDDLPLVPLDHAQIEQVLTNVLENALKYSPADAPVEVSARVLAASPAQDAPAELEVRVSDRGIGIPTSELRAIFGKFYRVQRARVPGLSEKPPAGTGLGLAISDAIVRAHGGRIWAESRPGEGTTIAFTLPIPPGGPHGALPELPVEASSAPVPAPTDSAVAREVTP